MSWICWASFKFQLSRSELAENVLKKRGLFTAIRFSVMGLWLLTLEYLSKCEIDIVAGNSQGIRTVTCDRRRFLMGPENRLISWIVVVPLAVFCSIWMIDRAFFSTVKTYQTAIEDLETEMRHYVNANTGSAPFPYSNVKIKIPEEEDYLDYKMEGWLRPIQRPAVGAEVTVTVLKGKFLAGPSLRNLTMQER